MEIDTTPGLHTTDVVSTGAIFLTWTSTFLGWLPVAAAVAVSICGAIYYALNIYYHPAVREYFRFRAEDRVLKMKIKLLKAQLSLAREDTLGHEFWVKISQESRTALKEIQDHINARREATSGKLKP